MDLSLTDEQYEIYLEHEHLVPVVINSNFGSTYKDAHLVENCDLEQCARIGLIKGIKTYDDSKGMKPSTYYVQSMKWEATKGFRKLSLRTEVQYEVKAVPLTPIDLPLNDESDTTVGDTIVDENDSFLIEHMTIDYENLAKLDERLPKVVELLIQDYSIQEIEKLINSGRNSVRRLTRKFEREIKESIYLGGIPLC